MESQGRESSRPKKKKKYSISKAAVTELVSFTYTNLKCFVNSYFVKLTLHRSHIHPRIHHPRIHRHIHSRIHRYILPGSYKQSASERARPKEGGFLTRLSPAPQQHAYTNSCHPTSHVPCTPHSMRSRHGLSLLTFGCCWKRIWKRTWKRTWISRKTTCLKPGG